jgi:hypothetical protein
MEGERSIVRFGDQRQCAGVSPNRAQPFGEHGVSDVVRRD